MSPAPALRWARSLAVAAVTLAAKSTFESLAAAALSARWQVRWAPALCLTLAVAAGAVGVVVVGHMVMAVFDFRRRTGRPITLARWHLCCLVIGVFWIRSPGVSDENDRIDLARPVAGIGRTAGARRWPARAGRTARAQAGALREAHRHRAGSLQPWVRGAGRRARWSEEHGGR